MHTFNIKGVPADASIFPAPQWLSDFLLNPQVSHTSISVKVGIIPAVEAKMKELGAKEWFANWSGKITPNPTCVSITYR